MIKKTYYCDICNKRMSENEYEQERAVHFEVSETDKSCTYSSKTVGKYNIKFTAKHLCKNCALKTKKQIWFFVNGKFKNNPEIETGVKEIVVQNEKLAKENELLKLAVSDAGIERLKQNHALEIKKIEENKEWWYKQKAEADSKLEDAKKLIKTLENLKNSLEVANEELNQKLTKAAYEIAELKDKLLIYEQG